MVYSPYQIRHFYLHEQFTLPILNLEEKGSYLVFWWKEVALGDFYLERGEALTEQNFLLKLIEAIEPAIDFYANGEHLEWQKLLLERKLQEWAAWMNKMLSPILPSLTKITPTVPISVIICTRSRAPQLQKCLEQLTKLPCAPEEIVVVDNAPIDDSTRAVTAQFKEVTYVKEPRPGLDIARNTGVLTAKFTVVAFADDDVVVHPWWAYRVWETFQDPERVAMTGLVIASELDTEAQYTFEKHWSFNRGYRDKIYDKLFFDSTLASGPPVWQIGAGANMAFRKSIFGVVGYFDERLDVGAAGCNGDSEMWFRILAHGYEIYYNPRAVVFHEHRKDMAGLKKQLFYYMRGFTTAALLQHQQYQRANYRRRLYLGMPKYYSRLVLQGFPQYRFRYSTLHVEISGILSGLIFYYKNRKRTQTHGFESRK